MTRPDPRPFEPLDDEERELARAIEADDYASGPGGLTPERMEALRTAARAAMAEPSTKVSICLPRTDLARLKARALREGVPYQTLIKSILHQAVQR